MKKIVALILSIAMVAALGACSSNNTAASPTTGSSSTAASAPSATAGTDTASQTSSAPASDSISVGVDGDCGTLDPYALSGSGFLTVMYSILEPLWIYDGTGNVKYLLCESMDTVSNTEYILHLRHNVTFSNGSPFTADDVIFTFNHVFNDTPRAYNFASLDLKKTVAKDDYTIDLFLTKSDVTQLPILSDVVILDKETFNPDTVSTDPIGTGAYVVTDYVVNSTCTVVANDKYWGGEPAIKKIVFKNIPESSQKVNALETGDIDYIVTCPTSDADYIDKMNGAHAIYKDSIAMVCLTYNCASTSPLNSKEARWAVSYATNSQGIIDVALNGHGSLAKSIVAPACNDYYSEMDNVQDTYSTGYNLDLAKKYAQESGLVGKTVRLVTNGSDVYVTAAQIIEQALKEIGVNAEVENYDQATVRNLTAGDKDWEVYVSFMSGSSGYGTDLIYAQAIKFNRTHFDWDTETFAKLKADGETVLGTTDPAKFKDLAVQYIKEYEDYCPVYGIASMQTIRGCSDALTGVSTTGYAHDRIFEWSFAK